jgi:environmental stress-induced protein Ves
MQAVDVFVLPAVPWKNGGGVTRNIAVCPPGAGLDDFDWRVSIADVAASGAFSRFPGVDRTILLLEGAGMMLGDAALTFPFEAHRFRGEDPVNALLVDGPSRDFNVMTRRGRVDASVDVCTSRSAFDSADSAVFFCARGSWRTGDNATVEEGQALIFDRFMDAGFDPQSTDAVLIAVLIRNNEGEDS